jgi:tape measure domain-containing protein
VVTKSEVVITAKDRTATGVKSAARNLESLDRQLKGITRTFQTLGGVVATGALVRFSQSIVQTADRFNALSSRVRDATRATGDFDRVWSRIGQVSQQTGAALEDTVSVFQRLAISRTELGKTNQEMLNFTKSVQQLGVISGASTSQLSAGLTQLGQGLGAGVLRAEEFNSLVENIPAVVEAIADGLGVTQGQLRQMVLEGRVLSTQVFDAIQSQSADIQQRFNDIPESVARATERLSNAWTIFIGQLDQALGITSGIATFLTDVSTGISELFKTGVAAEIEAIEASLSNLYARLDNAESGSLMAAIFDDSPEEIRAEIQALEKQLESLQKAQAAAFEVEGAEQIKTVVGSLTTDYKALGREIDQLLKKNEELFGTKSARAIEDQRRAADKLIESLNEQISLVGATGEQIAAVTNLRRLEAGATEQQRQAVEQLSIELYEMQEAQRQAEENARLLGVAWDEIFRDTIRGIRDAWSDFFFDVFQGEGIDSVSDFLSTVKDLFLRVIADIAAAWVTSGIFRILGGGISGGITSGLTGGIGSAIGGIGGGIGGAIGGLFGSGSAASVPVTVTALPPAAAIPAGIPLGAGGFVTSGAGGGAVAAGGIAGLGPAAGLAVGGAAVFGGGLLLRELLFGSRSPSQVTADLLGRNNNIGLGFSGFPNLGATAGLSSEQAAFARFAESQGARVQNTGNGVQVGVTTGAGGDFTTQGNKSLQDLIKRFNELKQILPPIKTTMERVFKDTGASAERLDEILSDGILNTVEQAELGFVELGDISVEKLDQVANAVDAGLIRLEALTGEVKFTTRELQVLGQIGVSNLNALANATGLSERGLDRITQSANSARNAVNGLSSSISNIPGIASDGGSSGGRGSFPGPVSNKQHGDSFVVGGRGGIDNNLIAFMASKGERVTVETQEQVRNRNTSTLDVKRQNKINAALLQEMSRMRQSMDDFIAVNSR